jgi:hypothetical protein
MGPALTGESEMETKSPCGITPQRVGPRPIYEIAAEIKRLWRPVYFGAVPYLDTMMQLGSISDSFGFDSAKSIIIYFLGNARTWKGEDAKRIKAELKAIAGLK